jgi:hypothetical protein
VKEEETSMFPKIVESDLDLKAMGAKLMAEKRKQQAARGISTRAPAPSSRGSRGGEARAAN